MSTEYIPYCYLIGWSSLNQFYYGRATRAGCNPKDLWTKYFTSSKYVLDFVKEHGSPDIILIRKTFKFAADCSKWENTVLRRINAAHHPKFLNRTNGDNKFDTTGVSNRLARLKYYHPEITSLSEFDNFIVETAKHCNSFTELRQLTSYNFCKAVLKRLSPETFKMLQHKSAQLKRQRISERSTQQHNIRAVRQEICDFIHSTKDINLAILTFGKYRVYKTIRLSNDLTLLSLKEQYTKKLQSKANSGRVRSKESEQKRILSRRQYYASRNATCRPETE